ncbi:hypothetical protein RSO01_61070 [Reyranella soli]|uniref:Uncharacterized protein n=1 Tax=Reyranella soli TaxID=1230389 RepID=A0A512NJ17_9HYPH|nr:hypothetical protein RSO01_61070 [Reyranella soli]
MLDRDLDMVALDQGVLLRQAVADHRRIPLRESGVERDTGLCIPIPMSPPVKLHGFPQYNQRDLTPGARAPHYQPVGLSGNSVSPLAQRPERSSIGFKIKQLLDRLALADYRERSRIKHDFRRKRARVVV